MLFVLVLVLVYLCNANNRDISVHTISLNFGSLENSNLNLMLI